mmetsp:Transcript_367/g.729  ORF Transcript_367/g.729 Transcript_367/m.729 type:complete len:205 (-) Transcript_367:1027-1641(-)
MSMRSVPSASAISDTFFSVSLAFRSASCGCSLVFVVVVAVVCVCGWCVAVEPLAWVPRMGRSAAGICPYLESSSGSKRYAIGSAGWKMLNSRAPPGSVKSRLGLGPRGQDSDKTSPRTARNMATGEPTAKRLSMSNSNCGHRHPALPLSCSPTTPSSISTPRSFFWAHMRSNAMTEPSEWQNSDTFPVNLGYVSTYWRYLSLSS